MREKERERTPEGDILNEKQTYVVREKKMLRREREDGRARKRDGGYIIADTEQFIFYDSHCVIIYPIPSAFVIQYSTRARVDFFSSAACQKH